MPGETALIDAAGGEFIPTLAAILVFAVLSGFFYMMRFIMDSNTKTNKLIVERLDKIIDNVFILKIFSFYIFFYIYNTIRIIISV